MCLVARLLVVFIFYGALASNVHAEGSVAEGERLARERCMFCHNVEPGGPFKQYPPSFAAIAVYRSAEEVRWRLIAPPLHSSMPQLSELFYAESIDSLVAYITSLEKP